MIGPWWSSALRPFFSISKKLCLIIVVLISNWSLDEQPDTVRRIRLVDLVCKNRHLRVVYDILSIYYLHSDLVYAFPSNCCIQNLYQCSCSNNWVASFCVVNKFLVCNSKIWGDVLSHCTWIYFSSSKKTHTFHLNKRTSWFCTQWEPDACCLFFYIVSFSYLAFRWIHPERWFHHIINHRKSKFGVLMLELCN